MHIVSQYAAVSHTLLLAAPKQPPLLVAPQIAGLLPSSTLRKVEVVIEQPMTFEELLRQLGPIRTREELNAELVAIIERRQAIRREILQ
jgi:hypothetical protein